MDSFNAAGPLMMLTTQALAIQTLSQNIVKKVSSEPQHEDPTPRRMQNYILDTVTKKCHNIPRTISV